MAIFFAFSTIPLLMKAKVRLSYSLFISITVLGLLSKLSFRILMESTVSIVTKPASLNTILTILMITVLGGMLKHYKIINEIINILKLLVNDDRKVMAIIPALVGTLIIPGGALLSAPFAYELGKNIGLKPSKSAAINLVYRHLAMFIFPYSTSLLIISATLPEVIMSKLVLLNLILVLSIIILGYFCFFRKIEIAKPNGIKNYTKQVTKMVIYTSPIYACIIINAITGLPFYITLLGSIYIAYLLGDKKDFVKIVKGTLNKNTFLTILTVAAILIMKEIVLNMEELIKILDNAIIASKNSMFSITSFFLVSSFIMGYITGLSTTALAIMLPFISRLSIGSEKMYIYTYLVLGASFLGYFISPLHLCQVFTLDYMGVTNSELFKEYRCYFPAILFILIFSALILQFIYT